MKLDHLGARCFLCGEEHSVFDTASRICDCVHPRGFPVDELCCYVTLLPEPKSYSVQGLPGLWAAEPQDVFAVATESLPAGPGPAPRRKDPGEGERTALPYPADHLNAKYHLRCGNSVLHGSSSLADATGFEQVLVLDMGAYHWSGTLKDPRSWAILNTALSCGIKSISVWTAGNAGLSLARMAYALNRRLPMESRLQIYAIVDNDVAPEIRTQLRLWQCEVLDVFRQDKPVLNPREIQGLVAARLRRARRHLDEESYWHVTDGWDGVGLLMYRYIAAQVLSEVMASTGPGEPDPQPLNIVLPVGTGDLLLGFYQGLKDCEAAGVIPPKRCRIIGAVPAGNNILGNIRQRSIPGGIPAGIPVGGNGQDRAGPFTPPVMPKLTGIYTPLAPCLARIEKEGAVDFVAVTEADQLRAGRQILSGGIDDGIPCEPSALAAFAALPHVNGRTNGGGSGGSGDKPWAYQSTQRVLVVSSGLGVLDRRESDLLDRALGL
jgi:hypothetical protein